MPQKKKVKPSSVQEKLAKLREVTGKKRNVAPNLKLGTFSLPFKEVETAFREKRLAFIICSTEEEAVELLKLLSEGIGAMYMRQLMPSAGPSGDLTGALLGRMIHDFAAKAVARNIKNSEKK